MTGVNIIIACTALLGFLPLATFLYRKRKADNILANGHTTRATVFDIHRGIKGNYDIVHYYFIAPNGREYRGKLTTSPRAHRVNNTIEVYYLPENPHHNTVKGAWKSTGFLIFMIMIAVAVLYMMYQLYKMVNPEAVI